MNTIKLTTDLYRSLWLVLYSAGDHLKQKDPKAFKQAMKVMKRFEEEETQELKGLGIWGKSAFTLG